MQYRQYCLFLEEIKFSFNFKIFSQYLSSTSSTFSCYFSIISCIIFAIYLCYNMEYYMEQEKSTTFKRKIVKNNINVILCFSEVSTASHLSSSTSMVKMNLYRILPWMWCFLIISECYNIKKRGEDGSKLIRIDGDIILGGIFPMHEQVRFFSLPMQDINSCFVGDHVL